MQLWQRRCVSLSRSADAVYGTAALRGCALAHHRSDLATLGFVTIAAVGAAYLAVSLNL